VFHGIDEGFGFVEQEIFGPAFAGVAGAIPPQRFNQMTMPGLIII
jgi:hypothetical protein